MSKLVGILLQDKYAGFCITAENDGVVVSLAKIGTPTYNLKYSYNGKTWYTFADSVNSISNTVTLNTGDKVYLKGIYSGQSDANYIMIRCTANKYVRFSGNLYSILDEHNFKTLTSLANYNTYTFYRLFYSNTAYINAEDLVLPATTLVAHCYHGIFHYSGVHKSIKILPALVLTDSCYYSFYESCYYLVDAPILPALILAENCYRAMFNVCYALIKGPDLMATVLATNCYRYLYNSCQSITYIKIAYTGNFSNTYFQNWVQSTAGSSLFPATGDFYYNGSDTTRGANAIPTGWTIKTFS